MAVNLYVSAIRDKVERLTERYGSEAEAFSRFVFYLVTGLPVDELELEDVIDGSGDSQIDIIHIQRSEQEALVTVLQTTFSSSMSSNKLSLMKEGLKYLLEYPQDIYMRLSNGALRDRIKEFRDLRSEIGPSNIVLQCRFACLGDVSKASSDFKLVADGIKRDYSSILGEFSFDVLGPLEMAGLLRQQEQVRTRVDEKLRIIYDQNKANLLEHSVENAVGAICTVEAQEIARIVEAHPTVFDDNLRRFLGLKGEVNKAIGDSCVSANDSSLFWFLNNGITIVCDDFDVNKDFDNPFINVKNLRIVNGCQTATTIARIAAQGRLQPNTRVLVRIFETASQELASKLVVTTNTQNKMKTRELHARHPIQVQLQSQFETVFGILLERTPNEFAGSSSLRTKEIISNEKLGQAYLGVVMGKASDANRRRYKIWGEFYENVFSTSVYPETYLLAYRITEYWRTQQRKRSNSPAIDLRGTLARNGTYHLSYITANRWRGTARWDDRTVLRQQLAAVEHNPVILDPYFADAMDLLEKIILEQDEFRNDPSIALKSAKLDDEIRKRLFTT